jgi:hypothetical protein
VYQTRENALFVFSHLEADMLVLVEHGAMHGFSIPATVLILEYLTKYLQDNLHLVSYSLE